MHGVGFGNVTVSPRKFSLISNLVFQSFQIFFLGGGGLSYEILFVSVLALVLSEERLETTLIGGPSINYVVSKTAIVDPLPPLVVFFIK